jgi:hypothetical protein
VAHGVGPKFKPQYHQKKKKERKEWAVWLFLELKGVSSGSKFLS